MERDPILRITAEAARHHGVFTRPFALAAGMTSAGLSRRVARRAWVRPVPGVYVVAGSPPTWQQAVAVAVYGSGEEAVASHATAAHLWGLVPRPGIIEVTVPHNWRPQRKHVIHRSTDLIPADTAEVHGIPCTTVPRCLVDMGIPWGEPMTSRALDDAVRLGLVTERQVAALLHRVARCGRNGVGPMRRVLADRLGWSSLTESQIEAEFVRIMKAAGVDLPDPQVSIVKKGGRLVARVDFVYPDKRLVIALDGERYHSDRAAFRRDRRQQNDLILEGFRILRFTAWDIFAAPEYVVASVVAALASHA